MPKSKSKNNAKEFSIYLILSPIDTTQMYIGKTYSHRLRKTYTEHIKLRVKKTAEMCATAAEQQRLPPLYVLETGIMTPQEAFRRCVAWTRYFLDLGYVQITEDILTEYAQDLVPATQAHYDFIKNKYIEDVLLPHGGLFADYGTIKKPRIQTDKHTISIRFDPEDYLLVRSKSHDAGVSMGQYCRNRILNCPTVYIDYTDTVTLWESHENEIALLKQILFSVYTTQKYYPADIQNIQVCAARHRELTKQTISEIQKASKIIQIDREPIEENELVNLISTRGGSTITVSCVVSEREYIEITQRADKLKMRFSAFCRIAALHGRIVIDDFRYSMISDYYSSLSNLMQQIMFCIYTTGKYYPSDLALIQSERDSLRKEHAQCLDVFSNYLHQLLTTCY